MMQTHCSISKWQYNFNLKVSALQRTCNFKAISIFSFQVIEAFTAVYSEIVVLEWTSF